MTESSIGSDTRLPRVAIVFCRQCKWNLRAAYFAQELLSTFEASIGEVALIPTTGGIFTVHLTYLSKTGQDEFAPMIRRILIWDRKRDGGFPETKILKQLVRNHIDPAKSLGHSDTPAKEKQSAATASTAGHDGSASNVVEKTMTTSSTAKSASTCEDCT